MNSIVSRQAPRSDGSALSAAMSMLPPAAAVKARRTFTSAASSRSSSASRASRGPTRADNPRGAGVTSNVAGDSLASGLSSAP